MYKGAGSGISAEREAGDMVFCCRQLAGHDSCLSSCWVRRFSFLFSCFGAEEAVFHVHPSSSFVRLRMG